MKTSMKTMAIKARVYNAIRKTLYKKKVEDFSNAEKIEFFNAVHVLNLNAHRELIDYKHKRRAQAKVVAERIKRGKAPKKKTTKEQWLASQENRKSA